MHSTQLEIHQLTAQKEKKRVQWDKKKVVEDSNGYQLYWYLDNAGTFRVVRFAVIYNQFNVYSKCCQCGILIACYLRFHVT